MSVGQKVDCMCYSWVENTFQPEQGNFMDKTWDEVCHPDKGYLYGNTLYDRFASGYRWRILILQNIDETWQPWML